MAKITAQEVNKLRKSTGVGMMDCKNALVEAEGDFDLAVEILRKKGQKVAAKRADRDAGEGMVIAKTNADQTKAIVLMLNCETDFVAKSEPFVDFTNKIAEIAIEKCPATSEELKALELDGRPINDSITDLIGKIGEKVDIGAYEIIEANKVIAYNHQGNRIATTLGLNKADVAEIETIGKNIAMQIASMAPVSLSKDDIAPEIVETELRVGREQALEEGKPENMVDKIAAGRLNKFFKENTLLAQDFVFAEDGKQSVSQYIAEQDKDLTITEFKRVALA